MSNQSKKPAVQADTGQKVAQQLTPPLITELRTVSKTILDGGLLTTPVVHLIGTADPGTPITVEDKAGRFTYAQTGEDGIWTSPTLLLERGEHVFTASAYTVDPPVDPVQSLPFTINVEIGERCRISGFYVPEFSSTSYPCGSIIPLAPSGRGTILTIDGQKGTLVQLANSGQSSDTPAPDSPLWGVEQTIPRIGLSIEVTPIGLLPISNWFHVRTVDEGPPLQPSVWRTLYVLVKSAKLFSHWPSTCSMRLPAVAH